MTHPPSEDLAFAACERLRCQVSVKAGRGQRWEHVGDPIDLAEACMMAHALVAYEVGIFVHGGYVYWTSRHADIFSSSVLTTLHELPNPLSLDRPRIRADFRDAIDELLFLAIADSVPASDGTSIALHAGLRVYLYQPSATDERTPTYRLGSGLVEAHLARPANPYVRWHCRVDDQSVIPR